MSQELVVSPEVGRFLDLVDKFADVAPSAQFTVLAYRSADKWTNLGTRLQFGGSAGKDTAFDIRGQLQVVSTRMSTSEAVSLLAEAAVSGTFQVHILRVHFAGTRSPRLELRGERLYFYGNPYDPGPNCAAMLSLDGPSVERIVGENQADWRSLEDALQNFDPPYLGLEDLGESHLGYAIGRWHTAALYALLLVPLKILEADVGRGGKLQLKLRRDPRIRREHVAFGVIVKPEAGVPRRETIPLAKATVVREDKEFELVQLDIPVAGNAEVILQLRARNEVLETKKLYPGIFSPRLRCHGILDPDETSLEKALTEKKGKNFEYSVATLLHLAGFKVEATGPLESLTSSRFADILAFTPDEQTIVVGACVFENPSPQDITLLAQSYLRTKETLGDPNLRMTPIMFTSVPAKTISPSLREQANREEIRIASREELLKALGLVRAGAGPMEVLQVFGSMAPVNWG